MFQGLDVLEIMRNIHVFVSRYLYNLNNQVRCILYLFSEFGSSWRQVQIICVRLQPRLNVCSDNLHSSCCCFRISLGILCIDLGRCLVNTFWLLCASKMSLSKTLTLGPAAGWVFCYIRIYEIHDFGGGKMDIREWVVRVVKQWMTWRICTGSNSVVSSWAWGYPLWK